MKTAACLAASLLVLALSPAAGKAGPVLVRTGADDSANYGDQWLGDGGFGFDPWVFRTETGSGYAGFVLVERDPVYGGLGLDDIYATDNRAWTIYANDGQTTNSLPSFTNTVQFAVAFRGFDYSTSEQRWTNALDSVGDTFAISLENDFIEAGGVVGFMLRNGNADASPADYEQGARLGVKFFGSRNDYRIVAGTNEYSSGVTFAANSGVRFEVTLTSTNTFLCKVSTVTEGVGTFEVSRSGRLAGSGTIDSVALFNYDASPFSGNNQFFNGMEILQYVFPDPPLALTVR